LSVDKRLKGYSKKIFRRERAIAKMNKVKKQRIRLSKAEIERARQELLEQAEAEPTAKQKPTRTESKYHKDFWRDGIYFDSYGSAWALDENLNSVYLGETKQVLKRESSFPGDNDSHSCHSKLKNGRPSILGGGANFVVATFKSDPRFLTIFEGLISKGLGIRATCSALKAKGYDVPLRTLGRWIKQREDKHD